MKKGVVTMTCKDCVHYEVCAYDNATSEYPCLCAFVKPKADFVEVVRCKDCKDFGENVGLSKDGVWARCYLHGRIFCERDYCSYGERKEKYNDD